MSMRGEYKDGAFTDYDDEEASATSETVTILELEAQPVKQSMLITTCDSLWLPACPVCSWVALWRTRSQDHFEVPELSLARNTSAHHGKDYYMLRGCRHATEIGCRVGPLQNRLWLAVTWRKRAAELLSAMFTEGYTPEKTRAFHARFEHPTNQPLA